MTLAPRYRLKWDAGKGQWVCLDMTTWKRVNAFDSLHLAERWVSGLGADALVDLDDLVVAEAEADR